MFCALILLCLASLTVSELPAALNESTILYLMGIRPKWSSHFFDGVVKSTQKGHSNPIYCVVAIF